MIEVGEYVRTKRGIAKVLEVKAVQPKMYGQHDVAYLIDKCPRMYITETAFIKHSKNIIDLIEAGDYVNGNEVTDKYLFNGEILVLETIVDETNAKCMCEGDIRTILTKEQYQANCLSEREVEIIYDLTKAGLIEKDEE